MRKFIDTMMRILQIIVCFKELKLKWKKKGYSLILEDEFIGYESFSVYTLERLKNVQ